MYNKKLRLPVCANFISFKFTSSANNTERRAYNQLCEIFSPAFRESSYLKHFSPDQKCALQIASILDSSREAK
jgi:hypothetical protein